MSDKLFSIIRATHSTYSGAVNPDLRLTIAAMGLAEEGGEVLSHVKKNVEQHRAIDETKLIKELADVKYYLGLACLSLGIDMETLDDVLWKKLQTRFPDGFSASDALKRVDEQS
jgi:NTP pyrophosphatase (non-canonical NTP hydrolase)